MNITKSISHKFYGNIQVLTGDTAISRLISDGKTIWEQHVVDYIRKYYTPHTNFVDVGAFIGLHTVNAAKHVVSPDCIVYSIEAQPKVYEVLKENVKSLPNVKPFWCIATCYAGIGTISCPNDYATYPNPGGLGFVDELFAHPSMYKQIVSAMRLDDLRLENVSLMKIDVEGHELVTLEGCANLLKTQRPTLIVEIMGGLPKTPENERLFQDVIRTIETTYNYKCVETTPTDNDFVFVPV